MKVLRFLFVLLAVVSLAGVVWSADETQSVTVTGKIVCAKCNLKKADAKECQNVVVAEKDGKSVEYYLVKNAVAEEFGHVCTGEKSVVATGSVSQKDGKTWLNATKLEQPKS